VGLHPHHLRLGVLQLGIEVAHELSKDALPHCRVPHIESQDDWAAGQKWESKVKIVDEEIVWVLKLCNTFRKD